MIRWLRYDRNKKSAGFALVDIILGIAILSVALVGIAFAYRQSTVTTVVARNYNQATYYAQQALENLKVNDGKTSASVPDTTWNQPYTVVSATGLLPVFSVKTELLLTVTEVQALSTLKPVQVTVKWQEPGDANDRTISIVGYYYLK